MIGRRGPAQAAFTNPEIRELCALSGADLIMDPKEMELDEISKAALAAGEGGTKAKGNVEILREQSKKAPAGKPKKLILRFLLSPVELIGKDGKVAAIKLEKNKLVGNIEAPKAIGIEEFEQMESGLVFRSIGYKGVPLPGLPYDEKKGTIPNVAGRITAPNASTPMPGFYAVGWAKRGPSGVIGTNKPDSIETVNQIFEDADNRRTNSPTESRDVAEILKEKKVRVVTYPDWKKLDQAEIDRGKSAGKIREKFYTIPNMLAAISN